MTAWFAQSRKAVTALVVGVIGWFAGVPDLHHITRSSWLALAIIIASALGVYTVTNDLGAGQQLAADAKVAGYVYDPSVAPPGPGDSTPGSSEALLAAQSPPEALAEVPAYGKPSVDGS